jgi:hypothetical protein
VRKQKNLPVGLIIQVCSFLDFSPLIPPANDAAASIFSQAGGEAAPVALHNNKKASHHMWLSVLNSYQIPMIHYGKYSVAYTYSCEHSTKMLSFMQESQQKSHKRLSSTLKKSSFYFIFYRRHNWMLYNDRRPRSFVQMLRKYVEKEDQVLFPSIIPSS